MFKQNNKLLQTNKNTNPSDISQQMYKSRQGFKIGTK